MKNLQRAGIISAKLIFVLIAAVGVIVLLVSLARSSKFETVQLNLSEGQQLREDQLRELGQLEEDYRLNGKLVLNQSNLSKYSKEKNVSCNYDLNSSMPKSTEVFESDDKGIEFSLPFNNEWGSDEFAILPYDELAEEVYFGPLISMPDCYWQRAYKMIFREAKPTAEILADLAMRNLEGEYEFIKIKDREGIKFVENTTDFGGCRSARIYFLGADYDYEFVVICSDDLENDFAFLEQVLLTVKID